MLARLLELNAERAKEEARAGAGQEGPRGKPLPKPKGRGGGPKKGSKRKPKDSETGDLFS